MTRREMREHCFKMLFCRDFYPEQETLGQMQEYFLAPAEEETEEGIDQIIHSVEMEEKDREELLAKSEAVLARIPEIDAKINEVTEGWKTRRMGKVELTILRLAFYEILYDESIPDKVAINEAVELGKKFGQEEAGSFINGILAKLVR